METTLKVNLSYIQNNYKYIKNITNNNVASVLKCNAYGLGVKHIALALKQVGCRDYFVSNIDEAIELRSYLGKEALIYVLHGPFSLKELDLYYNYKIIPVINNLYQLNLYKDYIRTNNSDFISVTLNFDIGMNRLGFEISELNFLVQNKAKLFHDLKIEYIMGHLSIAEDKEHILNKKQLVCFNNIIQYFPEAKKTLSNSSGVFLGKEYHFDMVRVGAALYGVNPLIDKSNPLQNPISLTSRIIQIRNVKKGEYVGYSCGYCAKCDIKVAIIPIGYGDGIKRIDSLNFYVIIKNKSYHVVGNISMDLIIINLEKNINNIEIGDSVEIIGPNNHHDRMAANINSISYEILTSMSQRYKKIYYKC